MRFSFWKLRYLLSGFMIFQAIMGTKVTHQADRLVGTKERELEDAAVEAGPHGNLIAPKAGKLIRSVGGLGVVAVKFMKYVGDDGQTIAIDVKLRPIDQDENRTVYLLGNGLTSGRNNTLIDVRFSSRWACGSYNLVITEHQFHKGVHISFQVAAPRIKITCLPLN